jgi:hypothetical protein
MEEKDIPAVAQAFRDASQSSIEQNTQLLNLYSVIFQLTGASQEIFTEQWELAQEAYKKHCKVIENLLALCKPAQVQKG